VLFMRSSQHFSTALQLFFLRPEYYVFDTIFMRFKIVFEMLCDI